MKRKKILLYALISTLVIITALTGLRINAQNSELKKLNHQKIQTEKQLHETEVQRLELEKSKATTEQQKAELDAKVQDQQKQIDDLNAQLQAKKAQAESIASAALNVATATRKVAAAPNVVAGCGDNSYAQFIYGKESGCNLGAVNPGGCIGIGQSCPGGSGLAADCPDWRTNYACQNAHFTRYAAKYGGWAGAYDFWLGHGWW